VYLKISINDGLSVKVVDGTDDLCAVEPGPVLGEDPLALQVEVQLAAVDVFGDQLTMLQNVFSPSALMLRCWRHIFSLD
jgi:hypothetical protein